MPWRSVCLPQAESRFGIDRMCMLLTDSAAFRHVLLFPTMKSLDAGKKEEKEGSFLRRCHEPGCRSPYTAA